VGMSLGPEWKYHISIVNPDWHLAEVWCIDNIGPFGENWYKLGMDIAHLIDLQWHTEWYFKKEQDYVLFSLVWA
jgi:hypothetical protein